MLHGLPLGKRDIPNVSVIYQHFHHAITNTLWRNDADPPCFNRYRPGITSLIAERKVIVVIAFIHIATPVPTESTNSRIVVIEPRLIVTDSYNFVSDSQIPVINSLRGNRLTEMKGQSV